jgi:hypothetical protein
MTSGCHFSVGPQLWRGWEGKRRKETEKRFLEIARKIAADVDYFSTHWGDPGPGDPVPEAIRFMRDEFRKINPEVEARIWTWYWNKFKKDPAAAVGSLGPVVSGIALTQIPKDQRSWDRVRELKRTGRRVGVFQWYFIDYENSYGNHLQYMIKSGLRGGHSGRLALKDLGREAMPKGAELDFVGVDRCWHAVPADINLYIAGQKMWDGSRSVKDIALDFLQAVYGPANAEKMWTVYETASTCQWWLVNGGRGLTQEKMAELAVQAATALKALHAVKIPKHHRPGISTPNTPYAYMIALDRDLKDVIARHYMMK